MCVYKLEYRSQHAKGFVELKNVFLKIFIFYKELVRMLFFKTKIEDMILYVQCHSTVNKSKSVNLFLHRYAWDWDGIKENSSDS